MADFRYSDKAYFKEVKEKIEGLGISTAYTKGKNDLPLLDLAYDGEIDEKEAKFRALVQPMQKIRIVSYEDIVEEEANAVQ